MMAKIEWYEEILALEPGSKVFFPFAKRLAEDGLHDKALAVLRLGLVQHPEYLEARVFLSHLLFEIGDKEAAMAESQQVFDRLAPYPAFWEALSLANEAIPGDMNLAMRFLAEGLRAPGLTLAAAMRRGLAPQAAGAEAPSSTVAVPQDAGADPDEPAAVEPPCTDAPVAEAFAPVAAEMPDVAEVPDVAPVPAMAEVQEGVAQETAQATDDFFAPLDPLAPVAEEATDPGYSTPVQCDTLLPLDDDEPVLPAPVEDVQEAEPAPDLVVENVESVLADAASVDEALAELDDVVPNAEAVETVVADEASVEAAPVEAAADETAGDEAEEAQDASLSAKDASLLAENALLPPEDAAPADLDAELDAPEAASQAAEEPQAARPVLSPQDLEELDKALFGDPEIVAEEIGEDVPPTPGFDALEPVAEELEPAQAAETEASDEPVMQETAVADGLDELPAESFDVALDEALVSLDELAMLAQPVEVPAEAQEIPPTLLDDALLGFDDDPVEPEPAAEYETEAAESVVSAPDSVADSIEEATAGADDTAEETDELVEEIAEDSAEETPDDATDDMPDDAPVRTRSMADVLAEQGDIDGALTIYGELLKKAGSEEAASLRARIDTLRGLKSAEKPEPKAAPKSDKAGLRSMLENLAGRLEKRAKTESKR